MMNYLEKLATFQLLRTLEKIFKTHCLNVLNQSTIYQSLFSQNMNKYCLKWHISTNNVKTIKQYLEPTEFDSRLKGPLRQFCALKDLLNAPNLPRNHDRCKSHSFASPAVGCILQLKRTAQKQQQMRCHMRRMYLASGMVDEGSFGLQMKIVIKSTNYHESIRNHFEFQNLKYHFQFYSIKFDTFKENKTQFHQSTEKLGFKMQLMT